MENSKKVLLLSCSRVAGGGFLDHALEAIDRTLAGAREVVFVPYALANWDGYTVTVADSLQRLGVAVRGIHTFASPSSALSDAEAVFVGGGNSFRLLTALESADALPVLRERAGRDLTYLGSSAGTNLACPTIRTTNDMPIVQPSSFEALGLVPFQINPHFVGGNPFPGHGGETREERIAQFHEVADLPVVGLPEPCWIEADGPGPNPRAVLCGPAPAVLFRRGAAPRPLTPGTALIGHREVDKSRELEVLDSPINQF
jgi:dipeptidase E